MSIVRTDRYMHVGHRGREQASVAHTKRRSGHLLLNNGELKSKCLPDLAFPGYTIRPMWVRCSRKKGVSMASPAKSKPADSTANLGLEAKWWIAADKRLTVVWRCSTDAISRSKDQFSRGRTIRHPRDSDCRQFYPRTCRRNSSRYAVVIESMKDR